MYSLLLFLQTAADGSTGLEVPLGQKILNWLLVGFVFVAVGVIAFLAGRFFGHWKAGRSFAADRERMFTIEKSLQEFFESDRKRLETETTDLRNKVELLQKKNEEYKQKAAGVGVMGMGKDRKAELLLQLMAENESLEEKLFEQNVKLKQERDEHLQRELQHVSVKRVMLSEILKEESVRDSIRNVLADDSRLKRVSLERKPEPPEEVVAGTAKVVDDAPAKAPAAPAAGGGTTDAEAGTPAGQEAPSA